MKRRVRKIINFFAFNLLFFALYLNFIHKDKTSNESVPTAVYTGAASPYTGTVLVQNPEKYLNKEVQPAQVSNSQNNQQ